jgi:hypothetical protein
VSFFFLVASVFDLRSGLPSRYVSIYGALRESEQQQVDHEKDFEAALVLRKLENFKANTIKFVFLPAVTQASDCRQVRDQFVIPMLAALNPGRFGDDGTVSEMDLFSRIGSR